MVLQWTSPKAIECQLNSGWQLPYTNEGTLKVNGQVQLRNMADLKDFLLFYILECEKCPYKTFPYITMYSHYSYQNLPSVTWSLPLQFSVL